MTKDQKKEIVKEFGESITNEKNFLFINDNISCAMGDNKGIIACVLNLLDNIMEREGVVSKYLKRFFKSYVTDFDVIATMERINEDKDMDIIFKLEEMLKRLKKLEKELENDEESED